MATSARRIRIVNPDLSNSERSQLDADYTSGTTLTVISGTNFANNDIVVVGRPGVEKAEAQSVASSTSTTVVLDSALNYSHQAGSEIFRSEYNQIQIDYIVSNQWTNLATIDIQWDKRESIYVHQGGGSGDNYRFRFYNSASSNYSEYSPTILGSGFTKYQVGSMIESVRRVINDPNRDIITDKEMIRFLNKAKNIVRAKRNDWFFWMKTDSGTITTVANTARYNLDDISTNIDSIRDVRFQDTSSGTTERHPLAYKGYTEMDDIDRDQSTPETDDRLLAYTIEPGDSNSTSGYLRVYPLPENTGNGSFYIRYYEPDVDFVDITDSTAIPLPEILEDYAIYRCLQIKGEDAKAIVYRDMFYGPADRRRSTEDLSGIALLERMNAMKLKPTNKPLSLKQYRGRNYHQRVETAGISSTTRDQLIEKYW